VTLIAVAIASVASTTLGLAFGSRFGTLIGERAGLIAGFVLIATGLTFGALKFFHVG
jgi:putative Mn2+ efflux pump MntP